MFWRPTHQLKAFVFLIDLNIIKVKDFKEG